MTEKDEITTTEETVATEDVAADVASVEVENVPESKDVENGVSEKKGKKQKVLAALNIAGYVLAIVIVIFTLYVSIITITRTSNKDAVSKDPIFGVSFFPVQSNSMVPTFDEGDLVIGKAYEVGQELAVGDIVTFKVHGAEGLVYFNTHRIVALADEYRVITMGDAYNSEYNVDNIDGLVDDSKTETTAVANIVAVYKSDVKGLGAFVDWMKDSTNYFILIVVPLIILFVLYIIYFVRMLMQNKAKKAVEAAVASVSADVLSEEDKQRIAREYLASLEAAKAVEAEKEAEQSSSSSETEEDEKPE